MVINDESIRRVLKEYENLSGTADVGDLIFKWDAYPIMNPKVFRFMYDRTIPSTITTSWEGDISELLGHQSTTEPEDVEAPAPENVEKLAVDEEYMKLAQELGLAVDHGEEARLRAAVADAGVGNYDREKVDLYMRSMAKNNVWVWRPLRKVDVGKLNQDGDRDVVLHGAVTGGQSYQHVVPFAVLTTVKQISEKFPEALFFISDYAAPRPDPFLMVTTKDLFERDIYYIVERWDEPGFRS
jgi:hypothetical protein